MVHWEQNRHKGDASDENRRPHVLVMNYSGLEEGRIPEAVARLCRAVLGE